MQYYIHIHIVHIYNNIYNYFSVVVIQYLHPNNTMSVLSTIKAENCILHKKEISNRTTIG